MVPQSAMHILSATLLPNVVEAEMHCRHGEHEAAGRILVAVEEEIESGFVNQLAICRERGWQQVSGRSGRGSD